MAGGLKRMVASAQCQRLHIQPFGATQSALWSNGRPIALRACSTTYPQQVMQMSIGYAPIWRVCQGRSLSWMRKLGSPQPPMICFDLHTEWVHFNKETYRDLLTRAERTIKRTTPADRISNDPAHWLCKMCDMYKLCHQQEPAEANCRTCCHSTPVADGKWFCNEYTKQLSADDQRKGCDSHIFIPALVHGTPIDGERNFVEYFVEGTGETFKNGPAHVTSKEVSKRGRKKPPAVDLGPKISLDDLNDDIPF